jgi:meiotic recombination protein SPO11
MFVKRVRETLKIPVLGLFDSDAHGLKILSVYMQGSESMSHDAASLATPDIKWLGVRPSDLEKYVVFCHVSNYGLLCKFNALHRR